MNRELSPQNFKRICIINWLLSIPLFILFAWPYWYVSHLSGLNETIIYFGSCLFSLPFMITILHGHVTMALGEAHRHHYYRWLMNQPLTYGLFFHSTMMRTRFRLILLILSFLIFITGLLIQL